MNIKFDVFHQLRTTTTSKTKTQEIQKMTNLLMKAGKLVASVVEDINDLLLGLVSI